MILFTRYLQIVMTVNDVVLIEQVVLKDEQDIDPNDQNSILEHLDKVVSFLLLPRTVNNINRID